MGVVKDPEVARRIARAVVSDIALYNPKKVEEGRSYYVSRIDPEILRGTNFYNAALVDILVKPMGRVASKVW